MIKINNNDNNNYLYYVCMSVYINYIIYKYK